MVEEYPDELSFDVGEVLIILEPSEVRYWYIAENSNHEKGIVPVTFLKVCFPHPKSIDRPIQSVLSLVSMTPNRCLLFMIDKQCDTSTTRTNRS